MWHHLINLYYKKKHSFFFCFFFAHYQFGIVGAFSFFSLLLFDICSLVHPAISPAARVLLWMNPRPTRLTARLLLFLWRHKATGLSTDRLITSFLVLSQAFFGLFQLPLLSLTRGFEKEPLSLQGRAHTRDFLTEIKPLLHRGLQ